LTDELPKPGFAAQALQGGLDAGAGDREAATLSRRLLQTVQGFRRLPAERADAGRVVAGEGVVRAEADPLLETPEGGREGRGRLLRPPLPHVSGAPAEVALC